MIEKQNLYPCGTKIRFNLGLRKGLEGIIVGVAGSGQPFLGQLYIVELIEFKDEDYPYTHTVLYEKFFTHTEEVIK